MSAHEQSIVHAHLHAHLHANQHANQHLLSHLHSATSWCPAQVSLAAEVMRRDIVNDEIDRAALAYAVRGDATCRIE